MRPFAHRRSLVAGILLGGVALGLLSLAGLSAWQGAERLRGRTDEQDRVAAVARAFTEAYGAVDAAAQSAAAREGLAALTTGPLREALTAAGPDPVAVAHQRQGQVRVIRVQLTALNGTAATAVVTADQHWSGIDPVSGLPLRGAVRRRLVCRLVREAGGWRVAALRVPADTPLGAAP